MNRAFKHGVLYPLQFLGAAFLVALFWILPFRAASRVGGTLARTIGPYLGASRTARHNLMAAFPDWDEGRISRTIADMWENLGRTIGEYPALRHMDVWAPDSPVEIVGEDVIDALIHDNKPGILFLGHLANWEYATLPAIQKGLRVTQLYRTLNNPYIARMSDAVHAKIAQDTVTKGASGARKMLRVMKEGGHLSMLVDQKLREGIPVPFFGREAMTPQALANLALKFDCPVVPVRVERLSGVNCRVTYYPPLSLENMAQESDPVYAIMKQVNDLLESWIREAPAQWIWVHNRWPKS